MNKTGLVFIVLLWMTPVHAKSPVPICIGSGSEWAPYTHYTRVNGKIDKTKLTGAAFDLIHEAFGLMKMTYEVKIMSWKRVQKEVAEYGTHGRCEMSWDASYKPERAEKFYYTAPLYRTHLGVFYSRKRFQNGLYLQSLDDLNRYQLCGVLGYNYSKFKLKTNIDTGSKTVEKALQKVKRGRCELFLSSIEPVYGGVFIGAHVIPEGIESFPIPGLEKTFYAFVSKTSPRAEHLLTQLNQAIIILQGSGRAETIFKVYLPQGSGI